MVTGIKPEESTNRKISDLLQPPHVVCPEIPEYISNTIMKAMAVDKHLRFTTVDDFEKAIDQKKKVIPLKKEKRRRKIRRFTTVFASLVLVLSAVSVFLFQWNQQKEEETLPDSSLEIWYIKSSDENQEDVKGKAFQEIIQEFTQSYPNVVIEARGISENDYDAELQTAIQEKKVPQIFENSEVVKADGLDLSEVLSSEEAAECYFPVSYTHLFGIVKLAGSEGFDLVKSRLIAAPLAHTMIQKHLVNSKDGDVNAYLKFLGVIPSPTGSYIDGLDLSLIHI